MQESYEASLSTLVFYAASVSETVSVPHTSLETNNARDAAQPSDLSSHTSLSNVETSFPTFGRQIWSKVCRL